MLRVRTTLSGWSGGPGLSTDYFTVPTQDAAAAARCVAYVQAKWAVAWKVNLPTTVTMQVSGNVDVLDAATGAITNTLSVSTPAAISGFTGTVLAPPATALLCRLQTATFIAGRRLQGRSFISPLAAFVMDTDGTPTAASIAVVTSGITNLLGSLTAGDALVVWHRPKAGAGGSGGPVTGSICPDRFAVLASRRP